MRKNLLLAVASICFALGVAEILTRRFVPLRDVGPLFTVNDALIGKRIKSNFHTVRVTREFTMTFTSNSFGFRGPEPSAASGGAVLFLGDSFTMGYGVNDGEEFPALIKAKLDATLGKGAISVVNAGMGNTGNGRWLKLLKAEAAQFNPRLVVLQVTDNDFEDNVREAYYSISDSGALTELPVRINKLKSLEPLLDAIPGLSHSYLYSLVRQSFAASLGATATAGRQQTTPKGDDDYAERLTERLIAQALSICRHQGYAVFAILVELHGERLRRVQAVFDRHRIPTLIVPPKAERAELYYKIDGHWNAAGHAFVADALFGRLRSLRLL